MAKAKKPSRQEQIQALIKSIWQGRAQALGLAVNPDFAPPNEIDRERGVEPDAIEREQAEHAIAARTLRELMPTNMRRWILHEEDRLGSRGALIDALMGVKPIPSRTRPAPKYGKGNERRAYREALKRAIQRSGPARKPGRKEEHQSIASPDYRERIALLILGEAQIVLFIAAQIRIQLEGDEDIHYTRVFTNQTQPDELETARRIIAAGGDGFVDFVMDVNERKKIFGPYPIELLKLHGVGVQLERGR